MSGEAAASDRSCGIVAADGVATAVVERAVTTLGYRTVHPDDTRSRPDVVVAVEVVVPAGVPRAWLGAPVVAVRYAPCSAERVVALLVAGADAVVQSGAITPAFAHAVDTVAAGGTVVDPWVARRLVRLLRTGPHRSPVALTRRERDVLELFRDGCSTAVAGEALGVAEKTVRNVQTRVFAKLRVRSRESAVLAALDLGLLDGSGSANGVR